MLNNKVLIIEDSLILRNIICNFLEEEGYDVHLAKDGKEGLELFYEMHPILVLLDLRMPVIDGFGFLDHVKLSPSDPCAVIVLTSSDSSEDIQRCFNYGVSGFLRTPINRSELKGLVKNSIISKWIEQNLMEEIAEHKRVEDELRESNRYNNLILESVSSILICVDFDDRITSWNTVAETVFGINATNVIRRSFSECGVRWDWEKINESISTCRREGRPIRVKHCSYKRSDMRNGFLNLSLNPIVWQKTAQPGFLLLGDDVTEHIILENELNQAQKLKSIGQLAAGIAHEINTPIQYIGDNIRFLQKESFKLFGLLEEYNRLLKAVKEGLVPSELISRLETAIEESDFDYLAEDIPTAIKQSLEGINRVTEIVKALKEFSHPIKKEKVVIDINRLIESTITVSRNEWKYVVEMKTNFDKDQLHVPCLPGEFNQVILNLIVNATHAITDIVGTTPRDKGTITISTLQDGDYAEIRVRDTGTGIPEEIRSRVFEPFFTTKEIGKGTGQGLSLAYAIVVEKHGGTITFETEVGKGTTFIIRLPMRDKDKKTSDNLAV